MWEVVQRRVDRVEAAERPQVPLRGAVVAPLLIPAALLVPTLIPRASRASPLVHQVQLVEAAFAAALAFTFTFAFAFAFAAVVPARTAAFRLPTSTAFSAFA